MPRIVRHVGHFRIKIAGRVTARGARDVLNAHFALFRCSAHFNSLNNHSLKSKIRDYNQRRRFPIR